MECYVEHIACHDNLKRDPKELIPDAALRRRMSRVVKMAVSTAVESVGGVEGIDALDAILTATGYGCLADSEKFLRNLIDTDEQLLTPTPFIQSTFNTVGGQIALLRHNRCYNLTYVNRSHSFEDALLDGLMRLSDGESQRILLGAFDERIPSADRILTRMGLGRKGELGEGATFMTLTAERTTDSVARIARLDFPSEPLTEAECLARYGEEPRAELIYAVDGTRELYPTRTARLVAEAARRLSAERREVIIYNALLGGTPTVIVVRWVG